ncbi:MAG: lycopene beta-cyclase CrtY [Alphaproteobacteria bacterium]|nr:MAG: lycopene beta-cyclase CrtY [Alphaproteobacteria bacterium]
MARGRRDGILIAGGGMAGCLAALAMARTRPEVPLLIVEERETFGGEGHRLFAQDELGPEGTALIDPIAPALWPGFYLAFPDLARKMKGAWGDLDAQSLHRAMVATLAHGQYRLGTKVVAVRDDALVLDGGETVKAEGAIDARGAANLSALELLYEARLERDYRFGAPHGVDRPVLIDATVDQGAGLRYFECVPLSEDRMAIADICISERSQGDEQAGARIDAYVKARPWSRPETLAERAAARPLPFGGDFSAFWRLGGARVAKIGLRGGFIHPVTGRAVGDAARTALLLARHQSFAGPALQDAFEVEAKQLWKKREPARSIVRAIGDAPAEARPALAKRLYGLDGALLDRLFADRPGLLDRGRLQRALRGT